MASTSMRVFGPYPSGNRWRLLIREAGQQQAVPFDTREQAEAAKATMRAGWKTQTCKTIGEALDEYLSAKLERGCKPRSVKTCEQRLQFLPRHEALSSISRERAESLYRGETEKLSVATHQKHLRDARAFFEFCVEQRYVATNPWKQVRAIGKANAGKPQLRRDEARKLSSLLLEHAAQGDFYALALTVQLFFGLRSAEVLGLRKRDLDADGTLLVIEGTKTRNARRTLAIASPSVRELLARRVAPLPAEALIFGRPDSPRPLSSTMLFKHLHRFCKLAGVPPVCPHSLRGLHSSLAVEGGATSAIVAAALGHGSDAITLKHYITPSAVDAARTERVAALFASPLEPASEPETDKLITALRALPPAQLERILLAVGNRR